VGANFEPTPPHDCRLTARCFRESFGFRIEPPYDFAQFRTDNSGIDKFYALRESDPSGGEGGERIASVKDRPVFSLHSGTMRGATWFDRERPPQGIVWLLGFEQHDERHKGRGDAYDVFAALEAVGKLYPVEVDYKLVEISRRVKDTKGFAKTAVIDAMKLLREAVTSEASAGTTAGVGTRALVVADGDVTVVGVALSMKPVAGELSKAMIPLTEERFLLLAKAFELAAQELFGDADAEIPTYEFPGGLSNERAFQVAFTRPPR
jgi:hypothetical protein